MRFQSHTPDTAPSASRPALDGAKRSFGFVPDALARMAESPTLVEAFGRAHQTFERGSLDPLEREVVVLAAARDFGCDYCKAMHLTQLAGRGEGPIGRAVLEGRDPDSPRLAALARFTHEVIASRGEVDDASLDAFVAAGFDRRAALDVVVGIGAYTMSMFANRLTRAEIDPAFTERA
jgi:AhpD family alkylhydroperoxidase